jgi:16S rRNA processing protein RimM
MPGSDKMTNENGDTADLICIGAIAGAFGVRGEVRLKSFAATPEDIAAYGPLCREDGSGSYQVHLTGITKNGLTARLGGVRTREEADSLRGVQLYVARSRLPGLPDDEYYHADLVGLAVHDTGGTLLGHVRGVQNHGASDLLELAVPGQAETVLLPFTRAAVPTVDLAAGRIVADPPDGLLPNA